MVNTYGTLFFIFIYRVQLIYMILMTKHLMVGVMADTVMNMDMDMDTDTVTDMDITIEDLFETNLI